MKEKGILRVSVILLATMLTNASCGNNLSGSNNNMHTNRLIKEKSPYLLQHAHNPVDWYAWGTEAFEKAKREDKPVFLSIGYSTCHWCHVMERESFENESIAKILNEHFISIKVDREERPDIDHIYMQAVMAMTGQGGWPLSVFITPDQEPFYGGTYFPPDDMYGRPGFKILLVSIADAWKTKRDEIQSSAASMVEAFKNIRKGSANGKVKLNELVLKKGFEQLQMNFDARYGGFGSAPKFPRSHLISFLFRYWKRKGEKDALSMAELTLTEMAKGGMYDQIGGGFHRYSTDGYWHIPHFEKMLYDQALLARTYLEAYQITKNETYADIAREIFEYVLRDLLSTEGGFFSAEDADSLSPDAPAGEKEKKEGAFYIWKESEIRNLLDEDAAKAFIYRFGVQPNGNARSDPQGEFKGLNTLYAAHSIEETATYMDWPIEKAKSALEKARQKLFEVRSKRPRPHLDDKILVDWNGLMIGSLAFGSRVLKEPRYLQAAERAAHFILEKLVAPDERLLHRYRDGEAGIEAKHEDYAFFIHGLLDLYEASFSVNYLAQAKKLADQMIERYWDSEIGGFFITPKDGEKLIARPKEIYDGAIPSGNSFALLDLVRLSRFTGSKTYGEHSEKMINAFADEISEAPTAYPQFLIGFDFALGPSKEIVIAGDAGSPGVARMAAEVFSRFLPNKIVVLRPAKEDAVKEIADVIPFIRDEKPLDGQPTAYVCENFVCKLPTTDMQEFVSLLEASK